MGPWRRLTPRHLLPGTLPRPLWPPCRAPSWLAHAALTQDAESSPQRDCFPFPVSSKTCASEEKHPVASQRDPGVAHTCCPPAPCTLPSRRPVATPARGGGCWSQTWQASRPWASGLVAAALPSVLLLPLLLPKRPRPTRPSCDVTSSPASPGARRAASTLLPGAHTRPRWGPATCWLVGLRERTLCSWLLGELRPSPNVHAARLEVSER